MFIVASTLLDLIKNMRAFAGLMVVSVASFWSDLSVEAEKYLVKSGS